MKTSYYTIQNGEFVETFTKSLDFFLTVPEQGANVAEGTVGSHPGSSPAWTARYSCQATIERDEDRVISKAFTKTPFDIDVNMNGQKIQIKILSLSRIPYEYTAQIGMFTVLPSNPLNEVIRQVVTAANRSLETANRTYLRNNYGSLVDKALADIPKSVRPVVVRFVSDLCSYSDEDKLNVYRNFDEMFGKFFKKEDDHADE